MCILSSETSNYPRWPLPENREIYLIACGGKDMVIKVTEVGDLAVFHVLQ